MKKGGATTMNNIFILTFVISFLGISVFVLAAIISLIRKRPAKKRFKFAGISFIIAIASFIGVGATMDETAQEKTVNSDYAENGIAKQEIPESHTKEEQQSTEEDLMALELPTSDQAENISIKSGSYDIAGETFQYSDSVRNDVTGNWRLSLIASSKDATEYAINYYNTLFGSDDEIHAIINFSNNTTSKISVLYSGMLDVTIHEYTDNEEHDAKQLFGGTLLNEYWVNTETGEVELIQ